jgi:hypothetical protein
MDNLVKGIMQRQWRLAIASLEGPAAIHKDAIDFHILLLHSGIVISNVGGQCLDAHLRQSRDEVLDALFNMISPRRLLYPQVMYSCQKVER